MFTIQRLQHFTYLIDPFRVESIDGLIENEKIGISQQ